MIMLSNFQQNLEEFHAIVNPEMKHLLEKEMEKFGLDVVAVNVSVENMVKRTLPLVSKYASKREEKGTYNYEQYEPLYKVEYFLRNV